MNVNIELKSIQLTQINMYRLSAFPEDRIKNLISELNVHYDKINNYIESGISGEKIEIEFIDSLAKLNEIFRLAPPYRINYESNSGDFRFGIDILESVIALLNTEAGNVTTRKKLLELGQALLEKLYDFSIDTLVSNSLLYRWLKKNSLVKPRAVMHYHSFHEKQQSSDNKIHFEPTDEELERFYSENRQKIYEYMVFHMNDQKEEADPMNARHASDFYHYFRSLENIKI